MSTAVSERADAAEANAARAAEVSRLERIERWKRRLPILPALLFTIFVTQNPFLFTLFYSLTEWRLDTPDPREFIGFDN